MKHQPPIMMWLFVLLLARLAAPQSLPSSGQAPSKEDMHVLWRFDTGG
jgi:hypothetical protein